MTIVAPRVLVVDDEALSRDFVTEALSSPIHEVVHAGDARSARQALSAEHVDLMVLDLGLPDEHGLDLLRSLRLDDDLPVIVLSGSGAVSDRVAALRMGADDYVVKPVDPSELAARCSAVLRRTRGHSRGHGRGDGGGRLRFDGLTIDTDAREVVAAGNVVDLTVTEFNLLAHLARRAGRVVTRDELLTEVWAVAPGPDRWPTVTEHIRRVRLKLGEDPRHPRRIRTARGVGYRFVP
jgi:two-component system phosphate regulon response regulator PhoB